MGDENVYKDLLTKLVRELKEKTKADIILITSNGDLPFNMPEYGWVTPEPTTWKRCEKIREVAAEENALVNDLYSIVSPIKEELIGEDQIHMNEKGIELLADQTAKVIRQALP